MCMHINASAVITLWLSDGLGVSVRRRSSLLTLLPDDGSSLSLISCKLAHEWAVDHLLSTGNISYVLNVHMGWEECNIYPNEHYGRSVTFIQMNTKKKNWIQIIRDMDEKVVYVHVDIEVALKWLLRWLFCHGVRLIKNSNIPSTQC